MIHAAGRKLSKHTRKKYIKNIYFIYTYYIAGNFLDSLENDVVCLCSKSKGQKFEAISQSHPAEKFMYLTHTSSMVFVAVVVTLSQICCCSW